MKRIILVCLFLMSSLQAKEPSETPKEVRDYRAVSALKAGVAATGAGMSLVWAYVFAKDLPEGIVEFKNNPSRDKLISLLSAASVLSLMVYSAYKLGYEAVPAYVKNTFASQDEQDEELED